MNAVMEAIPLIWLAICVLGLVYYAREGLMQRAWEREQEIMRLVDEKIRAHADNE